MTLTLIIAVVYGVSIGYKSVLAKQKNLTANASQEVIDTQIVNNVVKRTQIADSSDVNNSDIKILSKIDEFNYNDLPNNIEIHVVSGYEPSAEHIDVTVNRPGKNVVLILSSYEKIKWNIIPENNTSIVLIIQGSYYPSSVCSSINIPLIEESVPDAYKKESKSYIELLKFAETKLKKNKINSFYGAYSLPQSINIDKDIKSDDLSLRYFNKASSELKDHFYLYGLKGKVKCSCAGNHLQNNQKFFKPEYNAFSSEEKYTYSDENSSLEIENLKTSKKTYYPLPKDFPSLGGIKSITYLSDQNIVSMLSNSNSKYYIYRFDLQALKWKDYSEMGSFVMWLDLLSYDEFSKTYWGLETTINAYLTELSLEGRLIRKINLKDVLPGYLQTFNLGSESPPIFSVIPNEENIVLIVFKADEWNKKNIPLYIDKIWLLNKKTLKGYLTYTSK